MKASAGWAKPASAGANWRCKAPSSISNRCSSGRTPSRSEHIWQVLFRGGFFPAQRILTAAIAAIDIALWDIKGKALGVPVYELLGGRARDRVLTYNHNTGNTVEELVECCQRSLEEGWKVLRWGLAHQEGGILEPQDAVRLAIKEMEALRLALGDEVKLAIDVHTRLNPADALWLCQEFEQYRPYFVEDPLRVENSQSYRNLRGAHDRPAGRRANNTTPSGSSVRLSKKS